MTDLYETESFRQRVVEIIQRFRALEGTIRAEYGRTVAGAPPTETVSIECLLERRTRRFLIDEFLSALGWNPNEPHAVCEEARAVTDDGGRLYFDYLGLAPQTRFPVVVVEAKGLDLPMPGGGEGAPVDARDVVPLIVGELKALKRGETTRTLTAQWTEWLRNMGRYIAALSSPPTLSRVAITAGRWFVVFRDPIAAFRDGQVRHDDVFCFASFEDIVERHADLFALLGRDRLVDTLPLVLDIDRALQMIRPQSITECYRAVAVVTTTSGTTRRPYPTRSVYPGVVVLAGGRCFGIVDWKDFVEEPRGADSEGRYAAYSGHRERSVRCIVNGSGRSEATLVVIC